MLEHIYQPLLPYLFVKKLIMFTTCNKFLYSISETYLKDKCQELYDVETPIISWRYTLSLLKYGKRDIPVIFIFCGEGFRLQHVFNIQIYANYKNNIIWNLQEFGEVEYAIEQEIHCTYYTSRVQVCELNKEIEDSLEDYINNYTKDYNHNLEYMVEDEILEFPYPISTCRKNCKRIIHCCEEFGDDGFYGNKYIGLATRDDGRTLFETITSIDIFMTFDY